MGHVNMLLSVYIWGVTSYPWPPGRGGEGEGEYRFRAIWGLTIGGSTTGVTGGGHKGLN